MDEGAPTLLIPNELCKAAGIAASWHPINQLSVFPFEKRNFKQKDVPSQFASKSPPSVFCLRQNVILFHPILRKLVNESNGTFLNLQSSMVNKQLDRTSEILKISRQYRSIIRACLENLQNEMTKHQGSSEKEELQNYITIFYSVECVWHLCEILFMEVIPGNVVLPFLLDWVRFHFPRHGRRAALLLAGDVANLEYQEGYWDTVFGNLLQGRINVVRALLKQHSAASSPIFRMVDHILKTMPTFNVINSTSVSQFNLQWRHWANDIQMKIDAKQFISNSQLDLIVRLLVGEEQAWAEVQSKCEAWYEFLAGWLFYTEPSVKTFELGQFAKHSITKMNMKHNMRLLDRVLLAAMEFDVFEVIKEIQFMTENSWFVSHLTDILYHAGKLSSLEKEVENFSAEKLRESYVLDYGVNLTDHKSLWQVGLSYLDHCPNDGLQVIEIVLPRINFDTEAKAHKLIREARLRDLNHIAQSICKVQGMRCLKRGQLGNALTWSLKSQDCPFTSYLADKFLGEFVTSGKINNADLLDSMGPCMLASDRLIFLCKFYEFHKLYEAGEYKESASVLLSLLSSKIVPKFFWPILLTEAIPLLESEEIVFSSDDTYTILHCLEEKENLPELSDKISIIRLGAARNLSRSLMFEAQTA